MSKGKEFISQLKLHSDYLKWDEELGRYEKWEEACDKILNTHTMRYGDIINNLIDEVKSSLYKKEFLASQRNLQFRGNTILRNNCKIYNCCTTYAYSPDLFNKSFFVLLSGTGLGVSLKQKFVSQLPKLNTRNGESKLYIVEDSIEGWAESIKVLISSYCSHPSLYPEYFGKPVKFDLSKIRKKGAFITGGFKAPGPNGLKSSIEKIESLINNYLNNETSKEFKSIVVYDILMHISDAVLSGGIRRSAMNVLIDEDDSELLNAKIGNWRQEHPHRARSNNSVGLLKHNFPKEKLEKLISLNSGDNDLGFVFLNTENEIFNPCFEIGMSFYDKLSDKNDTALQFCNLNEINASACVDSKGRFSEDKFYELCRNSAILGTFQAGYTNFPYLGKQTEEIVTGEALIGVSITGWMTRPELFNKEILNKGAKIVIETNKEVAKLIGINQAARTTTVKPSGNASVILKTASGIHPEHSKRYFRIMQLNKESEVAKWLEKNTPNLIEDSKWSASNSDYVVYAPCENNDNVIVKTEMKGVKHLELIKLVQEHWVNAGKVKELCYNEHTTHNVSNTVIIDDINIITNYLYDNQDNFAAVSFLSEYGDKDYTQAPFTSVLNTQELINRYGDGAIFMSGLVVDGLHYFDDDLWSAVNHVINDNLKLGGSRDQVLLRKDWIRRVKKFSKNYFKGNLSETMYCMKDVHLWHKWQIINRDFKHIDFGTILNKPTFEDISKYGAISCSGGSCEIVNF